MSSASSARSHWSICFCRRISGWSPSGHRSPSPWTHSPISAFRTRSSARRTRTVRCTIRRSRSTRCEEVLDRSLAGCRRVSGGSILRRTASGRYSVRPWDRCRDGRLREYRRPRLPPRFRLQPRIPTARRPAHFGHCGRHHLRTDIRQLLGASGRDYDHPQHAAGVHLRDASLPPAFRPARVALHFRLFLLDLDHQSRGAAARPKRQSGHRAYSQHGAGRDLLGGRGDRRPADDGTRGAALPSLLFELFRGGARRRECFRDLSAGDLDDSHSDPSGRNWDFARRGSARSAGIRSAAGWAPFLWSRSSPSAGP